MLDWLEAAQRRLEASVEGSGDLTLSPGDIEGLLELAREAAHESGDRTNVPLIAYLVGLAHGRSPHTELRLVIATALGDPSPQAGATTPPG
jgi:Domain of unknown function (DUF6457)